MFAYNHFVVVVTNLFMLYTIRKILRRVQLKKCGKDPHKGEKNSEHCEVALDRFEQTQILRGVRNEARQRVDGNGLEHV